MMKSITHLNLSLQESIVLKKHNRFEIEVSVFTSIILTTVLVFFHFSRAGFESYLYEIHQIVGLGFFILCLPGYYIRINKISNSTIGLSALITLLLFLTLILISFLPKTISNIFFLSSIYIGYLLFLLHLIYFFKAKPLLYATSMILFGVLIGLWLFGRVYSGYHSPLAFENFSIGIISQDTIFHSSILEMIKTNGIPSTGLNDTPYLPYHWGSHWLLARLSILVNISSTLSYNLLYPCLLIPIFLKSVLIFSKDLFDLRNNNTSKYKTGVIFWLAFLLLIVGFLPYTFTSKWAIWDSWVGSESYLVGLLYFFLLSSVIIRAYTKIENAKIFALYALALSILLPLIGLLKISLLIILLATCCYLFLRLKLYINWVSSLALAISIILGYIIFKATNYLGDVENDNFYLFHFIKRWTQDGWKGFFYYFHYFFTFIYIYLKFKNLHVNFTNFKKLLFERKLLDVEILIVISIMGLIPTSLLRIDGGSAYYFTDIQARVSISLVLLFVLENYMNSYKFSTLLRRILLIVPLLIIFSLNNIFIKVETAFNNNLSSRIKMANYYKDANDSTEFIKGAQPDILQYTSGKFSDLDKKVDEMINVPFKGLKITPNYKLFSLLDSVNSFDVNLKSKSFIYVPKQNLLWSLFNNDRLSGLSIPALTGIKTIGALPKYLDDNYYRTYGYPTYKDQYYKTGEMTVHHYKGLNLDSARNAIDSMNYTLLYIPKNKLDTLKLTNNL
ncbi:hypothetical protein SAMN05661096_01385 [Marivirga sericea]|uniref:Uncharacterized protein n=1 Tax=Marivirga sericea TaxID=1028 RepID=A0A1X7J710_9BACT|nr:hypothetical protein [Marivirga sericea]SMG23475.1 hypothetical protein SAMN05661096_01385 [Marivirga sericea]